MFGALVAFIILTLCSCGICLAQYYEVEVQPEKSHQYRSATYRLWLPPGVMQLKGLIIRQHGCGTDASRTGLDHANDLQWQALAAKHAMGLLGTKLENTELCAKWFSLSSGSDIALLKALNTLARQTSHPELATVPWALWGHSGGAFWCTNMLFKFPERVITVVARSGGYSFLEWNPKVKRIPVLWTCGEKDIVDNLDFVKVMTIRSFDAYRRFGAPWCLAIDPIAGHGNRMGRSFTIRWMDEMINRHFGGVQEKDSLSFWFGNNHTKEISRGSVPGNIADWSWFPSETLAVSWREFVKTGWVTDVSSPPAPGHLSIRYNDDEPELRWESAVDLESGIRRFNIYHDDVLLDSISGQVSNYGDAPLPSMIKFVYKPKHPGLGGRLFVTSVNHQGLESIPSNKVTATRRKSSRN